MSKDTECFFVGEFAAAFMTAHQNGRSLSKMMEGTENWARPILLDAYSGPRMSADKNKQDQIARHRDKWTLACYNGEISVPEQSKQ